MTEVKGLAYKRDNLLDGKIAYKAECIIKEVLESLNLETLFRIQDREEAPEEAVQTK